MPMDRFLIAPFKSGLDTSLRPFMIPDDAFAQLQNAYVFRGRVRKRFGSEWLGDIPQGDTLGQLNSRVRLSLGDTDAMTGDFDDFTPTDPATSNPLPGQLGQMFSVGTTIFTVYQSGAMYTTGIATGTFDLATGEVVITGAAKNTPVYWYPATPIMGLYLYEAGPINNQSLYAWDQNFAYVFNGSSFSQSGDIVWHSSNSQFFWVENWQGINDAVPNMYVTNFNATVGTPGTSDDPLYYYNGSSWAQLTPIYNSAGNFVQTCRLIIAFQGYLILLNTIENIGGTNFAFTNRARWSHAGSPIPDYSGATTNGSAWLEPNQTYTSGGNTYFADGASYDDAPTDQQIVSCEFIKNRLIVYFERSTYELAFTSNAQQAFVWQKLNTELGSESTFSVIPFDKEALTTGNLTGINGCNGSNVYRIDDKIPDEVFEFRNDNNGIQRVCGIRDYFVEQAYWTFPSISSTDENSLTFPNQVLIYNYKTGTWALNDDSITFFGYFEQQSDTTWELATWTWEQATWTWNSGVEQASFRQVVGGNQEGFVFICNPDLSRNVAGLQITNVDMTGYILTVYNHNLTDNDYVLIENMTGSTNLNGTISPVSVIDGNTISIGPNPATGTYTGGGTLARVSQIQILSKQWNPYDSKARNVYLAKIDFAVVATPFDVPTQTGGQLTIDYYPSASELSMIDAGNATGSIMGNNVLETYPYPSIPMESQQKRLWHPVYFQTQGECIQIYIYLTPEQMIVPTIALAPFELDAMILHTQPTSDRLQ